LASITLEDAPMKKTNGWRRPVAERTRARRQWQERGPSSERPVEKASTNNAGSGRENGASLGYKVSDEEFNKGKAHAKRHDVPGAGTDLFGMSPFGGLSSDAFLSLSERLMRDAMLWFEYFARAAGSARPMQTANAGTDTSPRANYGFTVDVTSVLPVELMFAPHEGAELRPLAVHDLRATDPDFPGIAGARVAQRDGQWHISVTVGPKQPVGLYTGIIFDREDGAIRGTLALNVKKR
jgi:hypothetical protein